MRKLPWSIEGSLEQRIAIRAAGLPNRYSRITNWLQENYLRAPFLTLGTVKTEAGAQAYELVDFAKQLGYTGWKELKEELLAHLTKELRVFHGELGKREIALQIYRNVSGIRPDIECCHECNSSLVFKVKRRWYLRLDNGSTEPRIRFCPACGTKLKGSKPNNDS